MSLATDVERLSHIPLFTHLEPEALRLLAFSAETVVLKKGDRLFEAGDVADCAYVVLTGSLALEYHEFEKTAPPNSLIGETALTVITSRPASACALEAATLLKVTQPTFRRVMQEYPDCAVRVRQHLAQNLKSFTRELESLRQRGFNG